jgi:hypothetical protein
MKNSDVVSVTVRRVSAAYDRWAGRITWLSGATYAVNSASLLSILEKLQEEIGHGDPGKNRPLI